MNDPSTHFFNILVFIAVARRRNVHFNLLNTFFIDLFCNSFQVGNRQKLTEYPFYVFFLQVTAILY